MIKQISVKMEEADRDQLNIEATRAGLTLAEYCRRALLGEERTETAKKAQTLAGIKAQLEAIATAKPDGQTAETLEAIKQSLDRLESRPAPPAPPSAAELAEAVKPFLPAPAPPQQGGEVLGLVAGEVAHLSKWADRQEQRREKEQEAEQTARQNAEKAAQWAQSERERRERWENGREARRKREERKERETWRKLYGAAFVAGVGAGIVLLIGIKFLL